MEEEGQQPNQAGARHGDPAVRHRRHPQEDLQGHRGLRHPSRRHFYGRQDCFMRTINEDIFCSRTIEMSR